MQGDARYGQPLGNFTPCAPGERYDPHLYAAVHRGTVGDEGFYAAQARQSDAVLELGCGYGRLLPALTRASGCYVGMDIHQGLLQLGQRKAKVLQRSRAMGHCTLVRADMTQFAFSRSFDLIVLPYSGLFCLQYPSTVLACFRAVRRHLAPGGRFVLDVYNADAFHEEASPEDQADDHEDWVDRVTSHGACFDVYERSRWDREQQHLKTAYRYEPLTGGGDRWGFIDHHYLLRPQLERFLAEVGLSVERSWGDFEGTAWTPESEHLVVEARLVSGL